MLMEQINEIVNDSFYVKKGQDYLPCEFAFLHISEEPNETYVAYFKHRDIEKPIIYWWEKDDVSYCEDSRRFIIDFVGEAYLSLYIKQRDITLDLVQVATCIIHFSLFTIHL